MHVLGVDQFTDDDLMNLFKVADQFRNDLLNDDMRMALAQKHTDKQICSLFYEPSTRTRVSFETAAQKLGMGVVSTENAGEFSSAAKGETIEDTARVLDGYKFSAIVIRHPETGIVGRAAAVSQTPIINAGDGKGEHPTQSLLDTYTIYRQFGRLDNLHIVIGGDLLNGRTARSLAKILATYPGNKFSFVSVKQLQMADDIKQELTKNGAEFVETDKVEDVLSDADVVYWTRLQKERLDDKSIDTGGFVLNTGHLELMPAQTIIMHPLPRVDEIAIEVDADPRAKYFEQAANGLYIRMALLDQVVS